MRSVWKRSTMESIYVIPELYTYLNNLATSKQQFKKLTWVAQTTTKNNSRDRIPRVENTDATPQDFSLINVMTPFRITATTCNTGAHALDVTHSKQCFQVTNFRTKIFKELTKNLSQCSPKAIPKQRVEQKPVVVQKMMSHSRSILVVALGAVVAAIVTACCHKRGRLC